MGLAAPELLTLFGKYVDGFRGGALKYSYFYTSQDFFARGTKKPCTILSLFSCHPSRIDSVKRRGGGGEKSSLPQLLPTHVQTHSIPPLLLLLNAINNNKTPALFARHFDTAARPKLTAGILKPSSSTQCKLFPCVPQVHLKPAPCSLIIARRVCYKTVAIPSFIAEGTVRVGILDQTRPSDNSSPRLFGGRGFTAMSTKAALSAEVS